MLGKGCATGGRVHQGLGYDFLHVAVDDCSRVAHVEVLADERGDTSAGFAARALAFYGELGVMVQQVMTDNGAGYRSGAFRQVLAQAGVGHLRTRPYRPQSNGKVERFNHTINLEWAYACLYTGNQARLDALPSWVHRYNHHHPHTALGGRSPMQILNNLPRNHS